MTLPPTDPRSRYVLIVNGKPCEPAPWSTVQVMAKHAVDCGNQVKIIKRSEESC